MSLPRDSIRTDYSSYDLSIVYLDPSTGNALNNVQCIIQLLILLQPYFFYCVASHPNLPLKKDCFPLAAALLQSENGK
jgi:hypothetical protein